MKDLILSLIFSYQYTLSVGYDVGENCNDFSGGRKVENTVSSPLENSKCKIYSKSSNHI